MGSEDNGICFGYHAFCLVDILAQKDRLKKWQALPDEDDSPQEIAVIRDTVGVVRHFGEFFVRQFKQFAKPILPDNLAALTPEQQEKFRRIMEREVVVERLSDTFVFSSRIANDDRDIQLAGLHDLLAACCTAMIDSLARRTPIRGAVTVGKGDVLEDGSFYGPALAEAHDLESKVAQYPRVVVSPTVLQLLRENQTYSQDADVAAVSRQIAQTCRSFIAEDVDGYGIVDFIGRGIRDCYRPDDPAAPSVKRNIVSAIEFVRAEYDRFRRARDAKLAPRYYLLKNYMESRLSLWAD